MRIYYFGELVEDTNATNKNNQTETKTLQTTLKFEQPQKTVMDHIDELLQDIDLTVDVYRPRRNMQGA